MQWMYWNGTNLACDFSKPPAGVELYSHAWDTEAAFDLFENVNVATDPKNKQVVGELHAMVEKQWGRGSCKEGYHWCHQSDGCCRD